MKLCLGQSLDDLEAAQDSLLVSILEKQKQNHFV